MYLQFRILILFLTEQNQYGGIFFHGLTEPFNDVKRYLGYLALSISARRARTRPKWMKNQKSEKLIQGEKKSKLKIGKADGSIRPLYPALWIENSRHSQASKTTSISCKGIQCIAKPKVDIGSSRRQFQVIWSEGTVRNG